MNVYNILKESAIKWPDNPAVHDEFGTLSFSELFKEAEYLKTILKANIFDRGS